MKKTFVALLVGVAIGLSSFALAQDCETGFRLFDKGFHETDAICIPENPRRIVVLDEGTMTNLLALGIQPLAVMDWGNRDYAQYLALNPDSIESVGTPDGPNFEAMLSLQPDLIVGEAGDLEWFGDNAFENLQLIAPTALSSTDELDHWQGHLLFLGEVLGKQTESKALIDSYEIRLQEFREAYAAKAEDATIAIIRSRPDAFNVYARESFIAETVKSAGLIMPEALYRLDAWNSISLEEIDLLSSDYLFVMARNEDEAEAFFSTRESPLWQFLPAVQKEQVYQVNWTVWVAGWNVVGAHLVIDDLFYYLLDEAESPTLSPVTSVISEGYGPKYDVERFLNQ